MSHFFVKNYRLIFLNLFIITLVGGSFMLDYYLFHVHLDAFRTFLIISLPVLLFSGKLVLYKNDITKYTFFFLIIWLLYALLSLFWCIDKTGAYKDILYLLFGIGTFVFLVSIKNGFKEFEQELADIWTKVFIAVMFVSIWEMYTAKHLVSNFTLRLHELSPFHQLNYVPVFTFDNPNHFAIYACLSGIIFIIDLQKKRNVVLNGFFIACSLLLIHILSSRFGIITSVIFAVILLFVFIQKKNKEDLKAIALSLGKFGLIICFILFSIFSFHKVIRVHEDLVKQASLAPDDHMPSTLLRKNLILNGYDFFKQSKGVGVGAGNYKAYIKEGKGQYETGTIDSPHNWFIEIISQYGAAIGILFLTLFIYVVICMYRSVKQTGFEHKHLQVILLLVCYTVMSNANSIFLPLPINWVLLSLITLYTDDLLENNQTFDA
ncbi:MAG: O-antigen ligase family protein [Bacteroidota bacterium]